MWDFIENYLKLIIVSIFKFTIMQKFLYRLISPITIFVCLIMILSSCSKTNPSPLSEGEIKGLINKQLYIAYQATIYTEENWLFEMKDSNSLISNPQNHILMDMLFDYNERKYKEESPIQYILKQKSSILLSKEGYNLRYRDHENDKVPFESDGGDAIGYQRDKNNSTLWWILENRPFKALYNNMDFVKLADRVIKIISIDSFKKLPNTYLVKYKKENTKGHIIFKMSKTDSLPDVIDFDCNEAFLNSVRDIFKVAPYEVTIAYFDYNSKYLSNELNNLIFNNLDDLIFNPKNIWEIENKDAQEILDKFKKGKYYDFCSNAEDLLKEKRENKKEDKDSKKVTTNEVHNENIQTLKSIVQEWNNAHNDVSLINDFNSLFDNFVQFYGTRLSKEDCIKHKKALLQKYSDFRQEINSNIDIEQTDDNECRCDFVKTVTVNNKTTNYQSYLILKKTSNEWKITAESDLLTDKNLAKKNK